MDIWRPVHITHLRPAGIVSWIVVEPRKQSLELRIARMDPITLYPAGLGCLVVYSPLTALLGLPGIVLMLMLSVATPPAVHQHMKRQALVRFGPSWRISQVTTAHFRHLPGSYRRLGRELAEHLDGMWNSLAARTGWLTADKLHDAHGAVWRAALLLLGTAADHALLRESARYTELGHLVEARTAELAGVETVVATVAAQLREAHEKVVQLDAVIAAEQDRLYREQHVAYLESRLTSGTTALHPQTMPPAWQDDLDAINACLEGALTVLSPDWRG
ncbi:hypothetical protein ABZ816_40915 [Actinosynnema sp. NPDC047251]|uniref:hypothetical protein n=1 Tax=Saccharothrix espanaensis TaxID=103731 RepID=UPI0002F18E24|nr:hypothetical protein [Saccharothrix espanaensis]